MATKVTVDLSDFWRDLNEAIPTAMQEEAAPLMENILRMYIGTEVYAQWHPVMYRRRYLLWDRIESKTERENGGWTLGTTSTAPPDASVTGQAVWGGPDGGFFDLLANRFPYFGAGSMPRDVIGPAQRYIDSNTRPFEAAIIQGIDTLMG